VGVGGFKHDGWGWGVERVLVSLGRLAPGGEGALAVDQVGFGGAEVGEAC